MPETITLTREVDFIQPCNTEGEVEKGCTGCDVCIRKAWEKHIVYGVVYEPDEVDTQEDYADAEEIEKAAHLYLEEYGGVSVEHEKLTRQVAVCESYLAPVALTFGQEKVKKGGWIMAHHVKSPELQKGVEDGTYTGFSMEGTAVRE